MHILMLLVGIWASSAGGGVHSHCCRPQRDFGPRAAAASVRPSSSLLFDRHPGPFNASMFAERSDWPSTESFYSPGQVIYFNERFIDYQGRGFSPDYTYRRFETYRTGVGYR